MFAHISDHFPPARTVLLVLAGLIRELEFAMRTKRKTVTKLKIIDRIMFWCARVSVDETTHNQLINLLSVQVDQLPVPKARPAKAKVQCPRCKKQFVNLNAHLARAKPCAEVDAASSDDSCEEGETQIDVDMTS
jgi:hypothetical protein